MYKLTYRNKFDREEKTIVGTTEENCIEKYRRETAAIPQNYEVVSIVNDEKPFDEKSYNDTVKEKSEKVIEEIQKVVKSMLKKPYTDSQKKREKIIKTESAVGKYIIKNIYNGKNCVVVDGKVIINCSNDRFLIEPTEEWFLSA